MKKELIYDEIGNLEIYDNHRYEWVKASQLESITGPVINASYTYDYSGLRKSKTVGTTTTEFIWAGGLLMAQMSSDGSTIAWHYDQSGKMMGFSLNNIPYFYLRNLQGDIVAVHDAAGNVVAEYEYDVWGKVLSAEGPLAGVNPIRYRGYYWDWETGYYYCQSRYVCFMEMFMQVMDHWQEVDATEHIIGLLIISKKPYHMKKQIATLQLLPMQIVALTLFMIL